MPDDAGGSSALTRAPLAGRYPASAAMALLGLCPFIVLTTAVVLLSGQIGTSLHTSSFGTSLSSGLANAGYAFGAVTAADLVLRIPQRWLFVTCEAVFTAATLLAALSTDITTFTLGRVLEGVTTGILLVVALPPLITKYGPRRFPLGALIINLGLFGMVTLGPLAGGITASAHAWRPLFLAVAGLGAVGMVLGFAAYEHSGAPSPKIGFDPAAIPLAFFATFLPFFAVSWLQRGGFLSVGFLVPFVVGVATVFVLVLLQFTKDEALMPVAPISNTLPVFGIGTAMVAGAAFTVLLELTISYLTDVVGRSPAATGGLLSPMLLGVAAAAIAFYRLVRTRWLALLVLGGVTAIGVAAAMILAFGSGTSTTLVPVVALLLGFGAGAAVSPGLFMGGMSVPSTKLGPTFALVELLRSEAAFILAPILGYVAATSVSSHTGGIRLAAGVTLGLLAIVSTALIGVLAAGGIGPHAPDLDGWLDGDEAAYHSPPLAEPLRQAERQPDRA